MAKDNLVQKGNCCGLIIGRDFNVLADGTLKLANVRFFGSLGKPMGRQIHRAVPTPKAPSPAAANAPTPAAAAGLNLPSRPPLETEIKHAETAYKNAQDVIKFMDTKSGVIAGFAFVAIGFVLAVAKEFLNIPADLRSAVIEQFKSYPGWAYVIFLIALASLIAGIGCIWCVVRCVTARPPHIASKLKHTILFPFYQDKDLDCAKEYYAKVKTGMTLAEIAAEYEHQLLNVGAILCKKITWHRRAAHAFLLQLTLLTLAGAIFLACFLFFTGKSQQPPQVPAAKLPTATVSNTPPSPPSRRVPSNSTPSSIP